MDEEGEICFFMRVLWIAGAELIEELRQKRMKEQDEHEKKVLEKIKIKMDRIKATQEKLNARSIADTQSHYEGKVFERFSISLSKFLRFFCLVIYDALEQPPLARSASLSSCTSQQTSPGGYHTPIDEEEGEEEPAPLTPLTGSTLQNQAPSPYSAIMTVSLEGYLEPQRMSFSSPPNSELNPRPPSPDDSFPVFSPPPYDAAPPYAEAISEPTTVIQRHTSIGPPWMQDQFVTPRQSVISYSSRSPLSHHTCNSKKLLARRLVYSAFLVYSSYSTNPNEEFCPINHAPFCVHKIIYNFCL